MTQLFNKFYIPEDVGISSVAIAQFLKECDAINYKLRTLHIVRHDKAIAEVSKYPFCALDKRLVYSVSKTFTSTAIGIAVKEGLLRVDDFLLDYFPECRDLDMDDAARTIKICHLLTMSTGHGVDTVGDMCNGIRPWPEIFFTRKIVYEPGTHFVYNSGGTYMLSELISRVTGMCLKDWLQTHLFDPLEITDVSWDKHGDVNTGAWGLLIAPVISQNWDFCTYIKVFTMAYAFSRKNGLRRHHTPTFPQTCRDVPDGAATMDIKFGRTVRGAIVLMEHLASIAWYFRKWIWLSQLLLKKRMEAEFSLCLKSISLIT